MTRRLSLMLAIAILLMVNAFAGEGGALDSFKRPGAEPVTLAEAEPEHEQAELAVARTIPSPAPRGTEPSWTDEIGMYGEEEEIGGYAPVGMDPTPTAPQPQQRRRTPRVGNTGEVGALEYHRQGIEE